MSKDSDDTDSIDSSIDSPTTTAINTDYKVLGDLKNANDAIGVLGRNTAGSGVTKGVEGRVDSPNGYGLYTPDDAKIEGSIATLTDHTVTVDGNRALQLTPENSGGNNDAGNVILGHSANAPTDSSTTGAAILGGGDLNNPNMADNRSVVCGGYDNKAEGSNDAIGGGDGNRTSGLSATIGGGRINQVSGNQATVGGGYSNKATDNQATVSGGQDNEASSTDATVGGGYGNQALAKGATISGGGDDSQSRPRNAVYDSFGTIGGGDDNQAGSNDSTANAGYATVAGGDTNAATNLWATVAGGVDNDATGEAAFVGGGFDNDAQSLDSTVVGGRKNDASGDYATVLGGRDNNAQNRDSGAFGRGATAQHNGAWVVGDSTTTTISSSNPDEFRMQHDLYAASTNSTSARAQKVDIDPVDPGSVLSAVADLEVSRWTYEWDAAKDEDPPRHLGPMAGDFYEAFGVGNDEEHITGVDADGVALAAIQGLNQKLAEETAAVRTDLGETDDRLDEQAERIQEVAAENEALREENEVLTERLAVLEERVATMAGGQSSSAPADD